MALQSLSHLEPSIFHSGSGGLADMSIERELCLICECPTADGAVLAAHVDKEKLQTWFFNVCEYELVEEIQDEDKICYFCVWQAKFLWESNGMSDESLIWWNLDLDEAAKELRKHYFEGNIEQCWVPLEEINQSESEEEETEKDEVELSESESQPNIRPQKQKCLYCGKLYSSSHNLSQHVKKTHKDAIRCENRKCATYFHTIEEREKHNEEVHEKSREQKIFKCDFCSKEFIGNDKHIKHVRQVHREFPVKCALRGCVSFFKTKIEMRAHFDSLHILINGDKMIDCEYCDYKTKYNRNLQKHVTRKHRTEKPFKCDECGEMFSTKDTLARHSSSKHKFKRCKICKLDVSAGHYTIHIRKLTCYRCKNKFHCSGLYQSHLKKCRETLLKCSKCPKSFRIPSLLVYHMKRRHGSREWGGLEHKALGLKCEPCKMYYKSAKLLKRHLNRSHHQSKLKHCAHCQKSFLFTSHLINHLAQKHTLLDLEFECDACKKRFISKRVLCSHLKSTHFKDKIKESCRICRKLMFKHYMRVHLLQIHDVQ